jgi:flagellar biosynthesis/type III secretory pathway M-ring protein FliF/YscJ
MADGSTLVEGPDGTMVSRASLGQEMFDEDGAPIGLPAGSGGPKTYDVIEEAFDAHLESINHLTRSKPETVAALIRSWVAEEQM